MLFEEVMTMQEKQMLARPIGSPLPKKQQQKNNKNNNNNNKQNKNKNKQKKNHAFFRLDDWTRIKSLMMVYSASKWGDWMIQIECMKHKEQLKLHFLAVKHNMIEAVLTQNVSSGRVLFYARGEWRWLILYVQFFLKIFKNKENNRQVKITRKKR